MSGPYSLSHAAVDEAAATWGVSRAEAEEEIRRQNDRANARVPALRALAAELGAHADIYPTVAHLWRDATSFWDATDTAIIHADGRVVGPGPLAEAIRSR